MERKSLTGKVTSLERNIYGGLCINEAGHPSTESGLNRTSNPLLFTALHFPSKMRILKRTPVHTCPKLRTRSNMHLAVVNMTTGTIKAFRHCFKWH